MKKKAVWYCEATVTYWDRSIGDYVEIDLDHYSRETDREAAEDDAREVWMEHGNSPETVTVRPVA